MLPLPSVPEETLQKALNALRRLKAGLPPRGGVSPEVPNDLYQAHLALYGVAARYAEGRRVLDLGCGTGYGSARLAAAGASEVVGIDSEVRSLAYARRRFAGSSVHFESVPEGEVPTELGAFGLIVAVDVLPHLKSPGAALDDAVQALVADGTFLAAVPPIVDDRTMEQHRAAGVHRSSLYLWDWESLFRQRFQEVRLFAVRPPDGVTLDFADPAPSRIRAEDFRVEEVPVARMNDTAGAPSAVWVGRAARQAGA